MKNQSWVPANVIRSQSARCCADADYFRRSVSASMIGAANQITIRKLEFMISIVMQLSYLIILEKSI
jgi:hypothetical protein